MKLSTPVTASGTIRVVLVNDDEAKLFRRPADPDKGGYHALLRRFQDGCVRHGGRTYMTCTEADAQTAARWWMKTGDRRPGSGGWQNRLPIQSLAAFLPSLNGGPFFSDAGAHSSVQVATAKAPGWYVYIKQFVGTERIKLGFGNARRATSTKETDNPYGYAILIVIELPTEQAARQCERALKGRFVRYHLEDEKYFQHPDITAFVKAERDRQGGTLPLRLRRS